MLNPSRVEVAAPAPVKFADILTLPVNEDVEVTANVPPILALPEVVTVVPLKLEEVIV